MVTVRLPTFLCHSPPVELLDEPGAPFSEAEHFLPAPLECGLGLRHILIGVPLLGGVLEVAGSLQLGREPGQLFSIPVSYAQEGLRSAQVPIAIYDELTVEEVSSRLGDLSAEDLRVVRDYEERNKNRDTLLEELDRKIRGG